MSGSAEIDPAALHSFLVAEGLATSGSSVAATMLAGGRSNLTYLVRVDDRDYVLRRPPLGDYNPRAHDVGREFRILRKLAPTGLPVPPAVAEDTTGGVIGVPFYLMEKVEGRVIESAAAAPDLHDAAGLDTLIDAVVEGLVSLHRIDPVAVGLADLGKPQGYTLRQVQRWTGLWTEQRFRPIAALDEAARRLSAAADRLPLDAEPSTIVHGDYNIGNLIIAPGRPPRLAAILDWEMATLGHPLMDLGLLLTYNGPLMGRIFERDDAIAALPGFPAPEDIAARYGALSGRSIALVDFFRALALFKILVLIEQNRARYQAGTAIGEGQAGMGDSTPANAEYLVALLERL